MEEIQRLARLARERAFQLPLQEREEEEEVEEEGNASVGSCASPDPEQAAFLTSLSFLE